MLSKVIETSARFNAPRMFVPPKITSVILVPRKSLALCSPITQRIASIIFDLPEPLGPTIPVIPGINSIIVLSAKDLKPLISSDLSFITYFSSNNFSAARAAAFSASLIDLPVPRANS